MIPSIDSEPPIRERDLASTMAAEGVDTDGLHVVGWSDCEYRSSARSGILHCTCDSSPDLRFFVKIDNGIEDPHGHRGGIDRESSVYRRLLNRTSWSPRFYGVTRERGTGQRCMIIDYVRDTLRISRQPGRMVDAATWLGRFHRAHAGPRPTDAADFLPRYDETYFKGWSERTLAWTIEDAPWLRTTVAWFLEDLVSVLLASEPTIVHGEFVPDNVLLHEERVVPVDWETTAIGAGCIDLAALIDGWSVRTVRACREAYAGARRPDGSPSFDQEMDAAVVYWHLRWLGHRPDRTRDPALRWRHLRLRELARERGVVS